MITALAARWLLADALCLVEDLWTHAVAWARR